MIIRLLVAMFTLLLTLPAAAQEKYPSRPISLVAPFPPGGVADLTARPVAAALEKVLKNPVLSLSSISIIPEADKLFDRKPAYTMDQLVPIALVSADPTILVVNAERPWKSVKEFVDDAKKRPGEISFSSSGVYGTLHMATEMLSHARASS
jgi:tripartite-type tricarboxylate transporter receptor subunit TctC